MIQLTFTYTKEEWVEARRAYLLLTKAVTRFQMACMALIAGFLAFSISRYGLTTSLAGLTVLFLIVIGMHLFAYFIQPSWIFGSTKKYHGEYRLWFSEQEIRFETQGISSTLGWSNYDGYLENSSFFYLLQGKHYYLLIPKRVFPTPEGPVEFKALLDTMF